ncbi:MAG TPA: M56 family metallopeptidase [Candidatus Krumholzibacterium sp.]|nr:M56 family metallopeptidase [Candidatus Krumholzibacterium sp.]
MILDIAIKSGLVIGAAGIATVLMRRSSAYTRNLVWVFALAGLLLLPALSLVTPVWDLSIIPGPGSWGASSYTPEYSKLDQEDFVGPPYYISRSLPATGGSSLPDSPVSLPWYAWTVIAWIAGGLLYLGWRLISHATVMRLVRNSRCVEGKWQDVLDRTAGRIGLRRRVRLLESDRIRTAITVGVFTPVVVLPAESGDWQEERICLVLSHELAHVKRWDTLIEFLALGAMALYWFHPLVWFAVKQLRIERERDCDDAVLCTGARPSDYAEMLMRIAADLGESARPVWQLSTISQGSNLKDRLMSILNPRVDRTRGGRRSAFVTGMTVLAVVFALSVSGIWNTQAQETPKKKKMTEEQLKEKQLKEEQLKKEQMKKELDKKAAYKEKQSGEKISDEEMKKKTAMKASDTFSALTSKEGSAAGYVAMAIKKKGAMAGYKAFEQVKQDKSEEYYIKETEFNQLGYVFLTWGKLDEAITVFKINAGEFPDSWNVYDSLGEAYMAAGKHVEATKNYEMALKLNPEAKSASMALDKLKAMANKI